jgi:hypothetical protein
MKRDLFGFERLYRAGDRYARTIRELLGADRTLDPIAIDAHLAGIPAPERTCLAAVRSVPPRYAHGTSRIEPGDLAALLRQAVARIIRGAPRPIAVALSGGLDSAIVLALVREMSPDVVPLVLDPQLPDYSEVARAVETASNAGVSARVCEVTGDDFRRAAPAAIAAFETPLYNLHPVAKYLLAREAQRIGIETVISGDGIDQVFTRDVSADYLPLASAAFDSQGIRLCTPFLDHDVIAHVLSLPPDPHKPALRDVAATLGIAGALIHGPKITRLAPPIDLEPVVPRARLAKLAERLGRALPVFRDDRDYVRWTTLALLVDAFEAWD